jgi:hypothetical protein
LPPSEIEKGGNTAMAIVMLKQYPGVPDVNAQFTSSNIRKTLRLYKRIKKRSGDYLFGDLTAKYYRFGKDEDRAWQGDLMKHYPKDVQDEIKRHIIHALTHVDHRGRARPIPLSIGFSAGRTKEIISTYDPSGPSFTIEIRGFQGLLRKALAERRRKKKVL